MPNKPARYGIKLWVTCDAKSSYAWKMQVYTGKAEEKEQKEKEQKEKEKKAKRGGGREEGEGGGGGGGGGRPANLSARVVLDLTEGLGPGRNVTCDNFFTSHDLARRLFAERGLTVLGTLRANKPEIPRELLRVKGREPRSSLFAFAEATASCPAAVAVSYLAKKAKNVLILSTAEAHVRGAAVSERADRKPLAVLDYNRTKGGVDNLDKVLATYSCRRKTSRWPLALFHNMVDVSAYNAFVIRRELEPGWLLGKLHRRRVFLERLGRALASPLICRRERVPREPLSAAVVLSVRRRAAAAEAGGAAAAAAAAAALAAAAREASALTAAREAAGLAAAAAAAAAAREASALAAAREAAGLAASGAGGGIFFRDPRAPPPSPSPPPPRPPPPPPPPAAAPPAPPAPLEPGKRKRCGACPRSEDAKTRTACRRCATYICKKCTFAYCPACASRVHEREEQEE